jgi:hypothetical protein
MEKIEKVIDMLGEVAEKIRSLEAEAQRALLTNDDAVTHREKLQEKTMLLMDLPDMVEPLLDEAPAAAAREIRAGVDNFARRAGQAMGLSSIFYMSALLYPDDYKEGDSNDLEKYIDRLRKDFSS